MRRNFIRFYFSLYFHMYFHMYLMHDQPSPNSGIKESFMPFECLFPSDGCLINK
ncbi:Uncharacterized protein TCM_036532 [Theobroma cacao]|uniref:Uncharacterized protein n=1 Tax=Theobroma cacao TaxID=3641 RepID=A0A061FJ64_THECC|nr:Uncharacterized protein TCM_036532 [Theobroma cacao]